ncbi:MULTISPECIES: hypothetical protein [unclassified Microbacterium]|uniref:hypothetical protein n=1 Tax=unclassified Microbacterium TaxID=2609290 RepID=UPI0030198BCA
MDPAAQDTARLLLTLLGGAAGVEIIRAIVGGISGSMRRRRAEVDRKETERAAEEARADEAERRLRIVTEHAHTLRVAAIQGGITIPEFPTFKE